MRSSSYEPKNSKKVDSEIRKRSYNNYENKFNKFPKLNNIKNFSFDDLPRIKLINGNSSQSNSDQEADKNKDSIKIPLDQNEFRNIIFSPKIDENLFKTHLLLIYKGLIYSKSCLKNPSHQYLKSKMIDLQEKTSFVL